MEDLRMSRKIDLNECFEHTTEDIKMHITALHELLEAMPEEDILVHVGIIPPCTTDPSSGKREFVWQAAIDLQEELSCVTNQLPMVVHTVKPDEDLQVVKLCNILKSCMLVIVPDDYEESLESAYLASEYDVMSISYSDAEANFKQDLERFNEFPDMLREIKNRLS